MQLLDFLIFFPENWRKAAREEVRNDAQNREKTDFFKKKTDKKPKKTDGETEDSKETDDETEMEIDDETEEKS